MSTQSDPQAAPRLTSFAPQLLVDDLARAILFYERLGFAFAEPWDGFYAIGSLDGFELHLKEAPRSSEERRHRREHEHLDAAAGVDGIDVFYAKAVANGVSILRPLSATAWGTEDFYVEDPDGNIIAFGGQRFDRSQVRMFGLIGRVKCVPGQRDALIDILVEGTTSMPGCLSYVVAKDPADADALWITEVWDDESSHRQSLALPQVQAAIARGRPLIAGFAERFTTEPVGGHGLGNR